MVCLQTLCRHPEVLKMALSNSGWGTKLTYLQSRLLGDFQVGGGTCKTSALYQDSGAGGLATVPVPPEGRGLAGTGALLCCALVSPCSLPSAPQSLNFSLSRCGQIHVCVYRWREKWCLTFSSLQLHVTARKANLQIISFWAYSLIPRVLI